MASNTSGSSALSSYLTVLSLRRKLREEMETEALGAFRNSFLSKKRKVDIAKSSKYMNKIRSFDVDQVDLLIGQLDTLNLNKYDNEIVLSIMQCLSEGKKCKDSDIPFIAKFVVEFVRRYPTAEELFLSAFLDVLKYVNSSKEEEISRIKKPVVLLFCELCLCGTVAKENAVGKLIKSIADSISASSDRKAFCEILVSFTKLYGYEYLGVYPSFLSSELTIKEELAAYPPILDGTLQSRFLSIIDSFYNTLYSRADAVWKHLSECLSKEAHAVAMHGAAPEGVTASIIADRKSMELFRSELDTMSRLLGRATPEFKEEEISISRGFDSLTLAKLDEGQQYAGPFADIEEHRFYTVIPDLKELVPSLYAKKKERMVESEDSDDFDVFSEDDLSEDAMEREIEALEARLQTTNKYESVAEDGEESHSPSAPADDLKQLSLSEKIDLLMEHFLQCYSADDVDRWCLEFCDLNQSATREALLETIQCNYRKRDHQPFIARAICELRPAFDHLAREVEDFVVGGFYGLLKNLHGRNVGKLLDVTSFITEMVRFNEFRPSLFLYCLRKLRLMRSLESAQVIALLVERCGPILLFVDQVKPSVNYELDRLREMCRNNIVDSDSAAILMNAYYTCRPEERPKVIRVQLPPQQRYLRHLLVDVLQPRDVDAHCQFVLEKVLKFALEDDAVLEMVVQEVLRVPVVCYVNSEPIAQFAATLSHFVPRFQMMLVDAIFENVCVMLDAMQQDKYQETVSLVEFLSALYSLQVVNHNQIFFVLYLLIEYNHTVTPELLDKYSFLPKRPMAVHPLVPDEHDSPFNAFRLKLAVHLFSLCGLYLPSRPAKIYLLYLQRYFLCKSNMDLATLYDYEAMLQRYPQLCRPIKSYAEADACVAKMESAMARAGVALKPHTFALSLEMEEREEEELPPEEEEKEVAPKEEVDEAFEKKYNELMKGSAVPGNHHVNLDNMIIPMELQHHDGSGKLLLQNGKKVKVASINVSMTEEEKQKLVRHQEYQKKENQRIKQKTLRLNQTQELLPEAMPVEQIHNKNIRISPTSASWKTPKE